MAIAPWHAQNWLALKQILIAITIKINHSLFLNFSLFSFPFALPFCIFFATSLDLCCFFEKRCCVLDKSSDNVAGALKFREGPLFTE